MLYAGARQLKKMQCNTLGGSAPAGMKAEEKHYAAESLAPDISELPPGKGSVHSVFPGAINLRLPSGKLAVFLPREKLDGPGFILLQNAPEDFREWGLKPGAEAEFCAREIRLPGTIVSLSGARIWQPSPPWPSPGGEIADILKPLLAAPRGLIEREVAVRAGRLVLALKKRSPDPAAELRPLLGAGEGLTPAGDDFTVGLLGGLMSRARGEAAAVLAARLRQILKTEPQVTTAIGRHFLEAAADGIFCEFFIRFTRTAARGSREQVNRAAKLVLAWGASSGEWLLRGFLLAGEVAG
jgi:hypothetical protein